MSDTPSLRRITEDSFENLLLGVVCPRGLSGEPLFRFWLDVETGEVLEESTNELIDGQADILEEVEALRDRIAAARSRYVEFDPPETRDDYRRMADFAESVVDPVARVRLLDALDGPGAFSRFKRMVEQVGLREEWFAFRDAAQRETAAAFLERHGFAPPGA